MRTAISVVRKSAHTLLLAAYGLLLLVALFPHLSYGASFTRSVEVDLSKGTTRPVNYDGISLIVYELSPNFVSFDPVNIQSGDSLTVNIDFLDNQKLKLSQIPNGFNNEEVHVVLNGSHPNISTKISYNMLLNFKELEGDYVGNSSTINWSCDPSCLSSFIKGNLTDSSFSFGGISIIFSNIQIGPSPSTISISIDRLSDLYALAGDVRVVPFWSEIQSGLGALSILSGPSASNTQVRKQLPDGWALEVISVYDNNGNIATGNGYRWYQVKDWTDGTTGWMKAGEWKNDAFVGSSFLPDNLPNQDSLRLDATGTYDSRGERANAISVLLEHYYNANNADDTLMGGVRNAYLKKNDFPLQVIAAMTLRESGSIDFDNEWVTYDYGHGIKQVTSQGYIGGASKIRIPECEGDSGRSYCYTPTNPSNSRSPKRYTLTKRYYTNTTLGMAANIKDGFNVITQKHLGSISAIPLTQSPGTPRTWKAPSDQYINKYIYSGKQYVVSEKEMRVLRTTRGYNGLGPDCQRFNVIDEFNYLTFIADEMDRVGSVFPTLPKDGEAAPFTDLAEKMRKVELDKVNISLCSPGVIRIIDEEGRVTGFVGPNFIDEIPTVVYDTETGKAAAVHLIDQRFLYQIVGTEAGTYSLYIDKTMPDGIATVQFNNMPLSIGEIYTYTVDWEAIEGGKKGVQVEIDRDGDGTSEEVFKVGAFVDDTIPPATTHNRIDHTMYLNADDGDGVGVSSITWSLNGGSWKRSSDAMVQVDLIVGENSLRFYATDYLGNTEDVQSIAVVVLRNDSIPIPTMSSWGLLLLIMTLPGIAGIATRMRTRGGRKGTAP